MHNTFARAARDYYDIGLVPVALQRNGKAPIAKRWPTRSSLKLLRQFDSHAGNLAPEARQTARWPVANSHRRRYKTRWDPGAAHPESSIPTHGHDPDCQRRLSLLAELTQQLHNPQPHRSHHRRRPSWPRQPGGSGTVHYQRQGILLARTSAIGHCPGPGLASGRPPARLPAPEGHEPAGKSAERPTGPTRAGAATGVFPGKGGARTSRLAAPGPARPPPGQRVAAVPGLRARPAEPATAPNGLRSGLPWHRSQHRPRGSRSVGGSIGILMVSARTRPTHGR